jgi:hypothetical protein
MTAETELDAIFSAYLAELRQAVVEVQQWRRRLALGEKYNEAGMQIDEIWPSGLASHPRIIAVFRKYWLQVAHVIEDYERREELEEDDAPGEEDWGADEDDEEGEMASDPRDVLLGQLREQAPDLFAHFKQFLFMPIGLDDYALLDEEAGHG